MDMHRNAPLTPRGREELVRRILVERQPPGGVAMALGVCPRTVRLFGDGPHRQANRA